MKRGDRLYVRREPTNLHDKLAIAIYTYNVYRHGYIHLGYVPSGDAKQLRDSKHINTGQTYLACLLQNGGSNKNPAISINLKTLVPDIKDNIFDVS